MIEQMDIEDWIETFLTDLVDRTGLDVAIEELSLDDEDTLNVQLSGPDSALVIGREGQVLDAFQHIVVSAAIHGGIGKRRVLVDVEKYRIRRETRVREEAEHLAEEALNTGESQDCYPMSPRERRLVHIAVAEIEGVATESLGRGDERFVRIKPVA